MRMILIYIYKPSGNKKPAPSTTLDSQLYTSQPFTANYKQTLLVKEHGKGQGQMPANLSGLHLYI